MADARRVRLSPDRASPAGAGFSLAVEIRAPRAALHAFLCDLHDLRELHPFIVAIDDLPPSPDLPGARRYRVVDRIPFGPFRLRTSYVAALEPVSEHEIRGHAWQKPGVRLVTTYTLHERGAVTELREHCEIDAPRLLRRIVATQGRRAHEQTLAKLKARFEA